MNLAPLGRWFLRDDGGVVARGWPGGRFDTSAL
jgi:hypothetical protein